MIWFFLLTVYPKVSRFDGLDVYNFNQTPPTPTGNFILWDDNTAILWDDNQEILWD